MARTKSLTGQSNNNDPVNKRLAVPSIATDDFVPRNGFRAVNASVAGLITIQGFDEQWVQVYVNTGWSANAGLAIQNRATASTDTATIKAVAIDLV